METLELVLRMQKDIGSEKSEIGPFLASEMIYIIN